MTELDLSVCIVNFRARELLRACLSSIYEHKQALNFEVIVVDQNSQDGSLEMLQTQFPDVIVLQTPDNQGYTRPMNIAMQAARGNTVLQLNPDTLVHAGALKELFDFLASHPDVGIVGPKVLNADGSLQKPCRRSEARPWDVIAYFSGLARLFPNDARFSGYFMGHMDEDQTHPVEGVSGSCMLIRRAVIDQIGYLDERFFAYQEDADYCLRARQAGWQIYYHPQATITHFGGQGGSRVQAVKSIIAWHRSYYLYYRKHFARDYFFLFNWLYYSAMLAKLGYALLLNWLKGGAFGGSRKPG